MRGHTGPPEPAPPGRAPKHARVAGPSAGRVVPGSAEGQRSSGRAKLPAGEGLPPDERLLRRADYLRCYRTGRRRQGALVALYLVPNQGDRPRIGITTSRKVGKSVVRHRLKRWIKEIYRRWSGRSRLAPLDLVAHLKVEAKSATFGELRRDLQILLDGLGGSRGGERRAGAGGGHT